MSDGNSVAYAVPRNAPNPGEEVVLPQPLPPSAVSQYQRILSLQDQGAYAEADQLISRLNDTSLVGAVLAARYLSPSYHATEADLLDWYAQYGNQPAAAAIYKAILKRAPHAAVQPPQAQLLPESTSIPASLARPTRLNDTPAWLRCFHQGLAAWQRGDIAAAAPLFQQAANMGSVSDDDRAAGAFWAARAALRLQQPVDYLNWLRTAATATNSFYGIIAGRLLGQGFGPTGIAATLSEADITAVDAVPNGHLAFALLQVGETEQASLALRAMWPDIQANPALAHAVMAVAARAGLVDIAIAIAGQTNLVSNDVAGVSLPLPALHPAGGFSIDPALVYALARTESGFNPNAVSPMGARGLMQLMPVTANFVARNQGISGAVSNPSANLALGQGYIRYLGQQAGINNNLLAILASYNAGPNAAAIWYSALQQDSDPLLFIETISNDQTRHFVHQVLADSWIYAEEIGLKPTSLDEIAEGNFPLLRDAPNATASN
ncbi:MAG TPA: lytic transglycosylase domain-containing protein [Acidocella sp.]|nr:lytic transglycosylase domain-containing protein [Acidocella sp.]HQU04284.1 lytic transglycosylase domain-containing protein [Acidocella sp.]